VIPGAGLLLQLVAFTAADLPALACAALAIAAGRDP
jgi:hypothetical protein